MAVTKKKFVGPRVSNAKNRALARLAKAKGYPSKSAMIRAIFDAALAESLTQ